MNHSNVERTRQLAFCKCHGELSEAEAKELSELLGASSEARREYWEIFTLHAALEWELASDRIVEDALGASAEPVPLGPTTSVTNFTRLSTGWVWLAAAACLLLTVSAATLWWRSPSRSLARNPLADAVQPHADQPTTQPVLGTIASLSPDSSWSFGQPGGRNAATFRQGDTVWLERGTVQLQLPSDTVAVLESPGIMQFVAPDRIRVMQGGVKIEVAEGATGFSVETDSAEVVDLGTVFSVNVQDGKTDVVVFDGEVDLTPAGLGTESPAQTPPATKRFRAGEAVQVAQDGTLSRIVNVQQSSPQQSDRVPDSVITSVKDNNVRDDFWNFYEVAPGSFGEDALAFVDRPHQWNGIRRAGMPHYLVGADYVKTFNDDKVTGELNVTVALSRPATLYVLLDMRVAPPDWLLETFEQTGDTVGLDEVPFDPSQSSTAAPKRLGVGPGLSIDRHHSIWKRVVPEGGTVVLGANGQLIDAAPEGAMSRANMYGVVAVPIDNGT